MRTKSLASLTLVLLLAACGGGGDDDAPDANGGGGPDAADIDSGSGLPDANTGPDARPMAANAANLGQVCNSMQPCPTGYTCLVVDAMATNGFCSLECQGTMDMTTCSNMFPGPGSPACLFTAMIGMETLNFCGIRCGTQWSPPFPTDCPTGLTCGDITGMSGMPDGMTDFCVP